MQYSGVCGACRQPIYGASLSAFGMKWHLDHLLCKTCNTPFPDGKVCEGADGYAYCAAHWKEKFCPPCGYCNEPIEGPTINALGKGFHPNHFVCFTCKCALTGTFYPSQTGNPLCETHYYEDLGLICGGCEKPIISGQIITMPGDEGKRDVKFHYEHFVCSFCKTGLGGQKFKKHNHKPYCVKCNLELFE